MKPCVKTLCLRPVLIASLSFTANTDGASSHAGLILSGKTLYRTAENGGSLGLGTAFGVKSDDTGFTNLYRFTRLPTSHLYTNSDGGGPEGLTSGRSSGLCPSGTEPQLVHDSIRRSHFYLVHIFREGTRLCGCFIARPGVRAIYACPDAS